MIRHLLKSLSIYYLFGINFLHGQVDSTLNYFGDTIQYTALKSPKFLFQNVGAMSIINADSIDYGLAHFSLQEMLENTNGVFAMNAHNYVQDLRISIRGFGARSAFGIRGIRLFVDGIPSSTPDGQGQLDDINLHLIKNIKVLKGPSSVLYGNASGGAIYIQNKNTVDSNYIIGKMQLGSFNHQQLSLITGLKLNQSALIISSNYNQTKGYRDYSGFTSFYNGVKLIHPINKTFKIIANINYTSSPNADDPGSLTADQVEDRRAQARMQNILYESGESINHLNTSLKLEQQYADNYSNTSYGYYSRRQFFGNLPFEKGGVVSIGRDYYGLGTSLSKMIFLNDNLWTINFSVDASQQNDDRARFDNVLGKKGEERLNQKEIFKNIGFSNLQTLNINKFKWSLGVRLDEFILTVKDRYLMDGDQTAEINYSSVNYSIGVIYTATEKFNLFTNTRTSFETPTLSELSSNPLNTGGFNNNLSPMNATNYEVGFNYNYLNILSVTSSLFYIKTKDEITPFELNEYPQRVFYQNRGNTSRRGIESSIKFKINNLLNISANYTFSNFKFGSYESNGANLKGLYLAGIPNHQIGLIIRHDWNQLLKTEFNAIYNSKIFLNDLNLTSTPPFLKTMLKVKWALPFKKHTQTINFGINNILNKPYFDNIRINAFGGRYYEPAPLRNYYLGWSILLK